MQTCPSCKSARLQAEDLEPGLKARLCPHCRGHWIPFADYLPWIETGAKTGDLAALVEEPSELFGSGEQPAAGVNGGRQRRGRCDPGSESRATLASPPLPR